MTAPPRMHGLTHRPGGSDPIPGLTTGGGDAGPAKLLMCWGGMLPTVATTGLTWRIPYDSDGSSLSFTLARAFARVEATFSTAIDFRLESSPGGGAFTPTTIDTVTVAAGDYDQENTGLSTVVDSGDLVRLVFATVGVVSVGFDVELIGSE